MSFHLHTICYNTSVKNYIQTFYNLLFRSSTYYPSLCKNDARDLL